MPRPVETPNGVLFPFDLFDATHYRLLECEQLPGDFEKTLIEQRLLLTAEMLGEVQSKEAAAYDMAREEIQSMQVIDEGWPAWKVAIFVGATAVGAVAVGFLSGMMYQEYAR